VWTAHLQAMGCRFDADRSELSVRLRNVGQNGC
jgi:hypothetical protein